MPLYSPQKAWGRIGQAWRLWDTPYVWRGDTWEVPKHVWVYEDGEWHLVWTQDSTAPLTATATLNGVTVDIAWTAPSGTTHDPEVADAYNVRRSDGTLVGTVSAGGTYLVNDPTPLGGTQTWKVYATLSGVEYQWAETNPLTLGLPPTGVTATVSNEGADSNVTVEWTGTVGVTGYRVRNVAGTVVATVSDSTALFVDTNPVAGAGPYTVSSVLASGVEASANSNSLTLAQAPSSLTGTQDGQKVTLSWSNANVGSHDQIQVVRGGASLAYLSRGATSYTDDPAPPGASSAYKVRAVISGNPGPYSNTVNVCSTPNVPASVTLAATTTIGQLKLSWANPSGSRTGYETQYKDDDGTWKANNDGTSPAYHTWSNPASGSRSMRVRTLSACGNSAWVTKSATPGWDTTPPAKVTYTSFKPESSYGRMVLRFTTASSDNHEYRVLRRASTIPNTTSLWVKVRDWTSVGNSQNVSLVVAELGNSPGQRWYNECYVEVKDKWGNYQSCGVVKYECDPSPTIVEPVGSTHWTQNYYGTNTTHPNRPFSGISGAGDVHFGYFFYNNGIRNAVTATATHGARSVTAMKFMSWRVDNACGPNTWVPVSVGTHALKVDPRPNWPTPVYTTSPSAINNRVAIGNANWGNLQWLTMDANHRKNLTTGSDYGIGLSQPSPHQFYCLYRFDLEAFGTRSGSVEITHLG